MGLRALLALCATPLVAGFGGLTYLRSIEDIEELHAPCGGDACDICDYAF